MFTLKIFKKFTEYYVLFFFILIHLMKWIQNKNHRLHRKRITMTKLQTEMP